MVGLTLHLNSTVVCTLGRLCVGSKAECRGMIHSTALFTKRIFSSLGKWHVGFVKANDDDLLSICRLLLLIQEK